MLVNLKKKNSALKTCVFIICFHLNQGAHKPYLENFTIRHFLDNLFCITPCKAVIKRVVSTKPDTKVKNNNH